ncbi:uncharacterized protein ACIBXB_000931 [Morphnus guianensis]
MDFCDTRLRDVEFCFVLLEAFDLTAVNIYKCLKQLTEYNNPLSLEEFEDYYSEHSYMPPELGRFLLHACSLSRREMPHDSCATFLGKGGAVGGSLLSFAPRFICSIKLQVAGKIGVKRARDLNKGPQQTFHLSVLKLILEVFKINGSTLRMSDSELSKEAAALKYTKRIPIVQVT